MCVDIEKSVVDRRIVDTHISHKIVVIDERCVPKTKIAQ